LLMLGQIGERPLLTAASAADGTGL
jgi:hypothetical protein